MKDSLTGLLGLMFLVVVLSPIWLVIVLGLLAPLGLALFVPASIYFGLRRHFARR